MIHVGADPDREGAGAMFHIKCNIAPKAKPVGFELQDGAFSWQPTSLRIEDVMVSGSGSAISDAAEFLEATLEKSPLPESEIQAQARQEGISRPTLTRAKSRLGVVSTREDFGPGGRWYWALPGSNGNQGTSP